jgi:cytochrome c
VTLTLAAVISFARPAQAQTPGDADAGQAIFKQKCAVCHSLIPGKKSVGPSLIGVVGRKAGQGDPNYSYSDEMKNSGKTWDAATLEAYLTMPRGYIPGIKMLFAGLPQETDRANLIAYLSTLK